MVLPLKSHAHLTINNCIFNGVKVDENKNSGRMVRANSQLSLIINHSSFTNLVGFSAIDFNGGSPQTSPSTGPSFVLHDSVVKNNSWVAKVAEKREQLPFYFIDVRGIGALVLTGLKAERNNVSNIEKSGTSPDLFGIFRMDTSNVKDQSDVTFTSLDSNFQFNTNCTPIVITGDKNFKITAKVFRSVFKNNSAAVTAGVSLSPPGKDSTVNIINCTFAHNNVSDSVLASEWSEIPGLITCQGSAKIDISGVVTKFNDNGKLRPISGDCKKSCYLGSKENNYAVCGASGMTAGTVVFSCILGISGFGLICYHIVYVVYILPKKGEAYTFRG